MKYIFLHGLGQDASSWNKAASYMGEKENIVCPDLTEILQGREVTYANLYGAFSKYCTEYSEPLCICGLSLGGILAMQYSIENPERVKKVVLTGTQYVMPQRLLQFQNAIFRILPSKMFENMGFEKNDVIKLSKSMMNLDFRQDLEKIKCPALVVCGEKDKANRKAAQELAGLIPHAELKIIENAGHEVNTDAPEKLGKIIRDFCTLY